MPRIQLQHRLAGQTRTSQPLRQVDARHGPDGADAIEANDGIFLSRSSGSEPYRQAFRAVHNDGTQHYRRIGEFNPLGAAQQLLIENP